MKIILAFVLLLPSVFESWMDRKGETSDGKRKDTLWFLFLALLLSAFLWRWPGIVPWKSIPLLLGWRLLVFDYLTAWLLIRNDVIVGKWYSYNGQTSKFDRLVSGIDWRIRMAIRIILFGASLWWFLV